MYLFVWFSSKKKRKLFKYNFRIVIMKQLKGVLILFIFLFLSVGVIQNIAADSETLIPCGGDSELIIMCGFGDADNSPFGKEAVAGGGAGGVKVPFIKRIDVEKFKEITFKLTPFVLAILVIILLCIIILDQKRKKRERKIVCIPHEHEHHEEQY